MNGLPGLKILKLVLNVNDMIGKKLKRGLEIHFKMITEKTLNDVWLIDSTKQTGGK
jgi:hypothetical protein